MDRRRRFPTLVPWALASQTKNTKPSPTPKGSKYHCSTTQRRDMGTPFRLGYIPYSYLDPLGLAIQLLRALSFSKRSGQIPNTLDSNNKSSSLGPNSVCPFLLNEPQTKQPWLQNFSPVTRAHRPTPQIPARALPSARMSGFTLDIQKPTDLIF